MTTQENGMDLLAEVAALKAERDALQQAVEQQKKLWQENQARLRIAQLENDALYMTSFDLSGEGDQQTLLRSLLMRTRGYLEVHGGVITLLDEQSNQFIIAAELGTSPSLVGLRIEVDTGISGQVLSRREPLIINDYREMPGAVVNFVRLVARANNSVVSVAAMPITWQNKVIGVINLFRLGQGNTFSVHEIDLLQPLNLMAGLIINYTRLRSRESIYNRQLYAIGTASTHIAESLDLSNVLSAATDALLSTTEMSECAIYQYTEEGQHLAPLARYRRTVSGNLEPIEYRPYNHSLETLDAVQFVLKSEMWLCLQYSDEMPYPQFHQRMSQEGIYSSMLMPLLLRQRIIGLVEIYNTNEPHSFTIQHMETVQALSYHLGIAMRHAQLHQQIHTTRAVEQAVLLGLAHNFLRATKASDALEMLVGSMQTGLKSSHSCVFLEDGNFMIPEVWHGFGSDRMRTLRVNAALLPLTEGKMQAVNDAKLNENMLLGPLIAEYGLRSFLLAPMRDSDGRTVGLLLVAQRQPQAFDTEHQHLLNLLASQTTAVIERIRLFDAIQSRNADLEAIVEDRVRDVNNEKERTNAILQATTEPLIVFNLRGYVQRINKAFEEQHKISADDAHALHCSAIFGFDLLNKVVSRDFHSWRGELTIIRADDSSYEAAVSISPTIGPNGRMFGLVASLNDISEFKAVERMKAAFVATVTHELKTPLSSVKIFTDLLKRKPERLSTYLPTIERESNRLQVLIDDLLTYSRDQRVVNFEPVIIEINQLVQTLIEDRRPLVESKGLTLEFFAYPQPLHTMADPKILLQAITNLLSNATNYTLRGGKITVSTRTGIIGQNNMLLISVTDTGLGLSPEDLAHLFDRFYRGASAQKSGAAGMGLGMSVVKESIERHQGHLTFESEVGRGTKFQVWLPWNQ
jgi:two-component system, OmpR family, phosphate regulon sensor histidine kinase PhoR